VSDTRVLDDAVACRATVPPLSEERKMPLEQRRPRQEFNPYIQGARGAFCLLLFIFHVANSGLPSFGFLSAGAANHFLLSLQYGVELFFGISGYVIIGAVLRTNDPWKFLRDRAIRILPVLWATMPLVLTLEYFGHRFGVNDIPLFELVPVLFGNLLCLPPVVPIPLLHQAAWSLSFEFSFYVFAAVSIWLRPFKGWMALLLVFPILAFLWLHPRAWFFLPGVLVASGAVSRPLFRHVTRHPLLFLALFLGAWWQVIGLDTNQTMSGWGGSSFAFLLIALVAATVAFQGIVDGKGGIGRLLASPVMQFLGLISYSLYMWEFVTMALVKHVIETSGLPLTLGVWSQAAFLLLALPPTIVVAWISQKWIEQGLCGWLRRLARNQGRRAVDLPT
jgi:peptidoglycan/LPS O-acetylase OafA/YrhL